MSLVGAGGADVDGGRGQAAYVVQRGPSAVRSTPRIATVISSPTTGSAHCQPIATPPAPRSTAWLVNLGPGGRLCALDGRHPNDKGAGTDRVTESRPLQRAR